jgi:hypothetical protein
VAYLTLVQFRPKVEFLLPEDVDFLESRYPGFIDDGLSDWSDYIDSRLVKRYAVPFNPPPRTILRWLVALETQTALNRRGYNPQDPQMERMQARFDQAMADIKEAANSEEALFGLPSGAGPQGDGNVIRGGPLSYTEASPYVSADAQEQQGICEDARGGGTYT